MKFFKIKDIAIDDITSNHGSCPPTSYCDFETPDICGFTDYPLAVFKWTRHKGSTDSSYTGPTFDHVLFHLTKKIYSF
jgi:hypothetical protein